MKKLIAGIVLAFSSILTSGSVDACNLIQDYVMTGGQYVYTGYLRSSTKVMQSYPLATVTVKKFGTANAATLYSDVNCSVLLSASGLTSSDIRSYYAFYTNDAPVDITFSGGGISVPYTFTYISGVAIGGDFLTQAAGDARYLQLTGGVLGGPGNLSIGGTLGVSGTSTLAALTASGLGTFNAGISSTTGTFSGLVTGQVLNLAGDATGTADFNLTGNDAGNTITAVVKNNATSGTGSKVNIVSAQNGAGSAYVEYNLTGAGPGPYGFLSGLNGGNWEIRNLAVSGVPFSVNPANNNVTTGIGGGSLTVTGDAAVGGTFGVTGASTLAGVTAGAVSATTLASSGATTVGTTLGVTGATTLSSTLGVTGATTLSAPTTVANTTASNFALDVSLDNGTNGNGAIRGRIINSAISAYGLTGTTAINNTGAIAGVNSAASGGSGASISCSGTGCFGASITHTGGGATGAGISVSASSAPTAFLQAGAGANTSSTAVIRDATAGQAASTKMLDIQASGGSSVASIDKEGDIVGNSSTVATSTVSSSESVTRSAATGSAVTITTNDAGNTDPTLKIIPGSNGSARAFEINNGSPVFYISKTGSYAVTSTSANVTSALNANSAAGQAFFDVSAGNGADSSNQAYIRYIAASGSATIWSSGMQGTTDWKLGSGGTGDVLIANGSNGEVSLPLTGVTAGTMTVANGALASTTTHRFNWTNAMITALGAVGAGDVSVCTIPAKYQVIDVVVVIDSPDTSANALTVAVGRTGATYIDYTVASDAKAAANTVYGDAAGERGTNLTGYDLPSYTGTTTINAHFIKTTTNLNTVVGSTGHIYVTTRKLP